MDTAARRPRTGGGHRELDWWGRTVSRWSWHARLRDADRPCGAQRGGAVRRRRRCDSQTAPRRARRRRAFVDVRSAGASGAVLRQRATTLAASPSIAVTKLGHQLGLQGATSIPNGDGSLRRPAGRHADRPVVPAGHGRRHGLGSPQRARVGAGPSRPPHVPPATRLRRHRRHAPPRLDTVGQRLEAFDNGLLASVAADGRLINVSGSPAHALGRGAASPSLSAASAAGQAAALRRRRDPADRRLDSVEARAVSRRSVGT